MMINASIMRNVRYIMKGGDYVGRILQIIPANGWYALYKDNDETISEPLVCFALVEDNDNEQYIKGMCCDHLSIDFADIPGNFTGYTKPATA